MNQADIVIVSTAAPHYLITYDQVARVMEERKQEPMFFIDISVPRNVDPRVHELEEVYLYNIDDLEGVIQENRSTRAREAEKAETIVDAEVNRFYETIGRMQMAPVLERLQQKYEGVRQQEMDRLAKKLADLTPDQRSEIERTSVSLVKKILNHPILFLGEQHSRKEKFDRISLFLRIFGLKEEDLDE
jgi:glutamyl-tRNA reductase